MNHAGTAHHDGRDVVPGLDVIDVGGLAPETFLRGERRTRARPAGFTFERGNQRGFLAAYESPRAFDQFDVELESAAQDVLSQQAVLAGLFDSAIRDDAPPADIPRARR